MELMDQIELMLHTIHQADVVWGDAKAANFLIRRKPWKRICKDYLVSNTSLGLSRAHMYTRTL